MSYGIRMVMIAAVAALLSLAPFVRPAAAGEHPAGAGEPKVVVELFTSQGCSRCLPADAYLAELARRPDIVALSFHVDYWNYVGWRDPFSSTRWSERQREYGTKLNRRFVYTPQIVVDGQEESIGSRRARIETLIAAARKERKLAITVSHPDDDSLRVSIGRGGGDGGTESDAPATIWVALYDAMHATTIGTGENKGTTLTNANVVRTLERVGTWRGRPMEITVALADFGAAGRDGCAIIVQRRGVGRILGAKAVALR